MTRPSNDPKCQRYIDDPDRRWYGGQWRTETGIKGRRALAAGARVRYREENRAEILDKKRVGGPWWVTDRKRVLGRQRAAVLEQLQELRSHNV